jgi:biofilm PGA synthesis N-glycosyltransferase PgaC
MNFYLLVKPVWDFTSGYRIYSRKFLEGVDFNKIPTEGYLFQIHMVYEAYARGLKVKEVPFLYKEVLDRGSKLPPKDIRLTFFKVLKYRAPLLEIVRHFTYVKKDYQRFVNEYEELLSPPALKTIKGTRNASVPEISIGIMAYNEEINISRCLESLERQTLDRQLIREIIIVSSGSTDKTNDIVSEHQTENKRIKLIIQKNREGKASAINEFLRYASGDICVLESADTVAEPDCLEHLVRPFQDEKVGICGAHPVPVNDPGTFIGFSVSKMWQLHHLRAQDHPKCGEMIAFRNILMKIPSYTAVDEAVIEALITAQGYKAVYVPWARLKNKGAENLGDFWRQRVRIVAGHKHLASAKRYKVSTYHSANIIKYLFRDLSWHPRDLIFLIGMIIVEASARVCGSVNFYLRDKNPYIWDIARSTKNIGVVGQAQGVRKQKAESGKQKAVIRRQ